MRPARARRLSIPVELSQIQTNLLETFANYNEAKARLDALLAPELSVAFGFVSRPSGDRDRPLRRGLHPGTDRS